MKKIATYGVEIELILKLGCGHFTTRTENRNRLGLTHIFDWLGLIAQYFTKLWITYRYLDIKLLIYQILIPNFFSKIRWFGHIMPVCLHGSQWPCLKGCVICFIKAPIGSWCWMSFIVMLALMLPFVLYSVISCHFTLHIYLISVSWWSLSIWLCTPSGADSMHVHQLNLQKQYFSKRQCAIRLSTSSFVSKSKRKAQKIPSLVIWDSLILVLA